MEYMLEGHFVPLSEEEAELMEEIFVATREAHNDGVAKTRIAGILSYFAAGAVDPKSLNAEQMEVETDASTLEERLSAENEKQPVLCPRCEDDGDETEITNVRTQLGGQLMIEPCGHVVEWEDRDELGDWAAQYDPFDDD